MAGVRSPRGSGPCGALGLAARVRTARHVFFIRSLCMRGRNFSFRSASQRCDLASPCRRPGAWVRAVSVSIYSILSMALSPAVAAPWRWCVVGLRSALSRLARPRVHIKKERKKTQAPQRRDWRTARRHPTQLTGISRHRDFKERSVRRSAFFLVLEHAQARTGTPPPPLGRFQGGRFVS